MTTIGLGIAGALAGIPIAAVAFAVPSHGRLRVPERWWRGSPAPPTMVVTTAAFAGAVAATVGAVMPPTPALPAFWVFAVIGVGLAIIDVRWRRLPFGLTGILVASCIGCFAVTAAIKGNLAPFALALTTGTATAATLLAVALTLPGQLGLGDVAFASAITLNLGWLGWHAAAIGLLTGLALQGTIGLTAKLGRGDDNLPMGPALLAGWLVGVIPAA